ncbi:MAG: fluoride efflux transporter CrcB [Alphaproteobacteria bacterium]|nr:fluoride efflux transporter CrcB [Alphaproteobacteria bacterium]
MTLNPLLIVFLGGGLGAALRYLINQAMVRLVDIEFPLGIMAINISGSVIMGFAAGYFTFKAGEEWSQSARLFVTTGILGGYTTFSAFSLDAMLLYERGEILTALFYVVGSVVLSILGLAAGLWAVRVFS